MAGAGVTVYSSTGYSLSIALPTPGPGVEFVALRRAVREAGELQQQAWLKLASGELVNRLTGAYIAGLRTAESLQYPYDDDRLAVGVFNVARHAGPIEHGFESFNLASRIRWGQTPKSRLGRKGWYIRIPFRHYSPPRGGEGATVGREKASMPRAVYNLARQLEPGERLTGRARKLAAATGKVPGGVRGVGPGRPDGHPLGPARPGRYLAATRSSTAALISEPRFKTAASFAAALAHARETGGGVPALKHRTGRYEGLFKSGAPGHSQYLTIRVITQRSQWWIPGRRGLFVAQRVAEQTDPTVRAMFAEAFRHDVERAVGGALGG